MERRFVVAGVILAVVGAVVFVVVQRQRGSVVLEPAPMPVVPEKSAVTTSVVSAPTVFTPGLASVVDRSLPSDERVHGLTSGKVTEVKDGRDLETLAQLLGDPEENDTVRHEIASLLARSGYRA